MEGIYFIPRHALDKGQAGDVLPAQGEGKFPINGILLVEEVLVDDESVLGHREGDPVSQLEEFSENIECPVKGLFNQAMTAGVKRDNMPGDVELDYRVAQQLGVER
jgi:hypothetical protein